MRFSFLFLLFPNILFTQKIGVELMPYLGHYGANFYYQNHISRLQFKHKVGIFPAPEYKALNGVIGEQIQLSSSTSKPVRIFVLAEGNAAKAFGNKLSVARVKAFAFETIGRIGVETDLNATLSAKMYGHWKGTARWNKSDLYNLWNWNGQNFGGGLGLKYSPKSPKRLGATLTYEYWQNGLKNHQIQASLFKGL